MTVAIRTRPFQLPVKRLNETLGLIFVLHADSPRRTVTCSKAHTIIRSTNMKTACLDRSRASSLLPSFHYTPTTHWRFLFSMTRPKNLTSLADGRQGSPSIPEFEVHSGICGEGCLRPRQVEARRRVSSKYRLSFAINPYIQVRYRCSTAGPITKSIPP